MRLLNWALKLETGAYDVATLKLETGAYDVASAAEFHSCVARFRIQR